jgi:hypothetical protein
MKYQTPKSGTPIKKTFGTICKIISRWVIGGGSILRVWLVGTVCVGGFAGEVIEVTEDDHHGGTGHKPDKKQQHGSPPKSTCSVLLRVPGWLASRKGTLYPIYSNIH